MSKGNAHRIKPHLYRFERLSYVKTTNILANSKQEKTIIDCSLGTNPFGSSSLAAKAARHAFDHFPLDKYPDPSYSQLKNALVKFWQPQAALDENDIIIGPGSSGLLEKINKVFIDNTTHVLGYCPQFSEYITDVEACGGHYHYVSLSADHRFAFDVEKFIEAMDSRFSLIYLDNPNNPTGQILPLNHIEDIVSHAQKKNIAVVVDEAYGDFMDQENSSIKLSDHYNNLITVRSFSKGSGLANLRVGYAVIKGPLNDFIKKIDMPFSISGPSAYIAAASLQDTAFIQQSRLKIKESKKRLLEHCQSLFSSQTAAEVPILVLGHPDPAVDFADFLSKQGILCESGKYFRNLGPQYVRIRIPTHIDPLLERLCSAV